MSQERSEQRRWIARIDVEALVRAMPLIKQDGLPGNGFGLGYFYSKHSALLEFFLRCRDGSIDPADNPLLRWMETAHDSQHPYREGTTRDARVGLCREAEVLYREIAGNGVAEPLEIDGEIRLPGVLDGGNRLAILRTLGVRHVRCFVNASTVEVVLNLRVGTVEGAAMGPRP